jgi:hypothetical protein
MNLVEPRAWLARVRHDLVKRLVWPARDARDLRTSPQPGELVVALVDDEGRAVTAPALWADLEAQAPSELDTGAFAQAVARATASALAGDVAGVLALEPAFDALAALVRSLEERA